MPNPIPHEITEDEIKKALETGQPIISWQEWNEAFKSGAASVFVGPEANRPPGRKKGRLYICSDTQKIFYDNGSVWVYLGNLVSKPLPGLKRICNLYFDQNTQEIVIEVED